MNRKITEKEAIAIFLREYRKYKDAEYVRKPIAYAMHQAWIEVDRREMESEKSK